MIAYLITNLVNGCRYVGITKRRLKKRWSDHLSAAKKGVPTPLYHAIRKYGRASFTIEALASAVDYNALQELEKALIAQESTHVSLGGYNVTEGGEGAPGRVASPEARAKLSAASKRQMANPEARAHLSNLATTQMNTPEAKAAVSARRKGQVTSPEIREKLSKALMGRVLPPESVEKIRQALLGKPRSAETRARVSAARMGQKPSPEARAKMSASRKGKPLPKKPRAKVVFSEEARANIRAGWLLRKQRGSANGGRPTKVVEGM